MNRFGRSWWAAALAILLLGAFVRYHDVAGQVVLDDEWHSLGRAATTDAVELATHYYPSATSIPVNVYHRLVLVSWGWTELSIRLLSIVASLATLLFFPWAVARLSGVPRVGLLAGLLFALSPFWIFYGSSARPYAAFFGLVFAACYFALRALAEQRARPWLLFAASGALAVWFHLFALPALASLALLVVWRSARLLRSAGLRSAAWRVGLGPAILGFGVWTALVVLLYGPAASSGMGEKLPPSDERSFDVQFIRDSIELISGARLPWLAWLLCAAAVLGLVLAAKRSKDVIAALLLMLAGSLLLTLGTRPDLFYVAIVTWRYSLSVFFLYFYGLATTLDALLGWFEAKWPAVLERVTGAWQLVGLGCLLLVLTPVGRQLQLRPNNFRLHSAFQERYSRWSTEQSYASAFFGDAMRVTTASMPRYYSELAGRGLPCRIVEYPLEKRDERNPFYFYQLHHHCEVAAGYSRKDATGKRLAASKNAASLHFKALVNVEDGERLRRDGFEAVVVHLNVASEAAGAKKVRASKETQRVIRSLTKTWGKPSYADDRIRVFQVRRPGA